MPTGPIKPSQSGPGKGPQSPKGSQQQKGSARKLALFAALASFLIYLVPLFNPHGGYSFWPPAFLSGLAEAAPLALGTAAGLLLLQAVFGFFLFWLFKCRGLFKVLGLLAVLPLLFFAVNFALLYAIPLVLLMDYDGSEDLGTLELHCRVADVTLVPVKSGVFLSLERAGEAWVLEGDQRKWQLLSLPDCALLKSLQSQEPLQLDFALPGGRALFSNYAGEVFLLEEGTQALQPLKPPPQIRAWHPILSNDGRYLVWLDRVRDGGEGPPPHIIKRRMLQAPQAKEGLLLDILPNSSLTILDAGDKSYLLYAYPNRFLEVDGDGSIAWGPLEPPGLASPRYNFRRLGEDGWITWDGYREEGASRIAWSLPLGEGAITLPRGRSIESLALSPDGAYIAYSSEGNSYFQVSGRLVLLKVKTGEVVFRRRLQPFSRVGLTMAAPGFLAAQSFGQEERGLVVYKLPPP